jgi:hypothetical protein
MQHGLMYQGGYDRNFPTLKPGTDTFVDSGGSERPIPDWPPSVDGVRFGYLEKRARKFAVARVQFAEHDIVLSTPVLLDQNRHLGGRRLRPEVVELSDDQASLMLDDMLRDNPSQSEEIARLLQSVNQLRRSRRGD